MDRVQTSGAAVSPRLSLVVKPLPEHAFRVSVSRAFRAPTPVENFLALPTAYPLNLAPGLDVLIPFTVSGNRDLNEVLSLGFEAGYTGVISKRHTLQLTTYRVRATDTIQLGTTALYSPLDPPTTWPFPAVTVPLGLLPKASGYRNTGRITNQGVEAALNSSWRGNTWSSLSYGYQAQPTLTESDPTLPVSLNEPPGHQFSALVGGRYGAWKGSAAAIFVGRTFWSDVLATDPRMRGFADAFTVINTSASYAARPSVELVLKATNLLNRQVQQHAYGDIIGREVSVYINLNVKRKP